MQCHKKIANQDQESNNRPLYFFGVPKQSCGYTPYMALSTFNFDESSSAVRSYLLQSGRQFIVVPWLVKIIGEGENGAINLMHCPRTQIFIAAPFHASSLSQYSQTLMRQYNWEALFLVTRMFQLHSAMQTN
jgi:hypothetical protein